jgi:hypothetical protein
VGQLLVNFLLELELFSEVVGFFSYDFDFLVVMLSFLFAFIEGLTFLLLGLSQSKAELFNFLGKHGFS